MIFLEDSTSSNVAMDFFESMKNAIINFFSLDNITKFGLDVLLSIIIVIIAHFLILFINWIVKRSLSRAKTITKKMEQKGIHPRQAINYSVIYFIQALIKVVIYTIVFFIILGIFNVDFSGFGTILAGAVAGISLSLQDVISAFAYGVIILSGNEYQIGDYVIVADDVEGTVKRIGMLCTILETYDGKAVYIPNNVVGKAAVFNVTSQPVRRITIDFHVPSNTNLEKVRVLCLSIANNDKRVLKDNPAYLAVTGFNDDSVSFSLRCFCKNADYWDLLFYLNENILLELQKINQKIGRGDIQISLSKKEKNSVQYKTLVAELDD